MEGDGTSAVVLLIGGLLPPPYGGIAKYMQSAIPFLLERGFTVLNLQPNRRDANPLFTENERYRTAAIEKGSLGAVAWLAARRPRTLIRLARRCRDIRRLGRRRYLGVLARTAAFYRRAHLLVGGGPIHVVHAFDAPWSLGIVAQALAEDRGARFVMTTFGELMPHEGEMAVVDPASLAYREVVGDVLRAADVVTSMTRHCADQVEEVGYPRARVRTVRFVVGMEGFHPGVDGSEIRLRLAPDGQRVLLFVGQIRPRKGPQTLVRALAKLRGDRTSRLVLVGPDYGFRAELERLARDLGVADRLFIEGTVPDAQLAEYYAACDVFLFPTCTAIECLGLSFVQAMFTGKPVIATRIAGAPEVIRDGVDGYLVAPEDDDAFAARIDALLAMPEAERAEVGAAGRARVHALFDEADVLSDLTDTYGHLLGD